jgi:hypothetical protein
MKGGYKMKNKNNLYIIGMIVVMALIVTLFTSNMTGNVVKEEGDIVWVKNGTIKTITFNEVDYKTTTSKFYFGETNAENSVMLTIDGEASRVKEGESLANNNLGLKVIAIRPESLWWTTADTVKLEVFEKVSTDSCSGNVCIIYDLETINYDPVGASNRVIVANVISSNEANFVVNGESTKVIGDGESTKLSDGAIITIIDITAPDYAGSEKYVEFSIIIPEISEEPVPVSSEVTYEGVLDMLQNCEVLTSTSREDSCHYLCANNPSSSNKEICVLGFAHAYVSAGDKVTLDGPLGCFESPSVRFGEFGDVDISCICC